jgi:hypothetical protein
MAHPNVLDDRQILAFSLASIGYEDWNILSGPPGTF